VIEPISEVDLKVRYAGAVRSRSPASTFNLVRPYFEQIGLTRLANVTGLDSLGVPTVQAIRPNAKSLSVSQGKGLTLESAKVSAAMEALELFHAEQPTLNLRLSTIGEMSSRDDLIDLAKLPRAFREPSPEVRTLWTRGLDLTRQTELWVPYGCVSMDLTLPLLEASEVFPPSSNGLASGNTFGEATLHGLLEVIERDAYTLFFGRDQHDRECHRVDLGSIADQACCTLIESMLSAGIAVAAWDVTSDLGIPTYLAGIVETVPNLFHQVGLACGSGAHLDPTVALIRALTEAAQARLTRIAGSRDSMDPQSIDALKRRTIDVRVDQDELLAGPMSFRTAPPFDGRTFDDDIGFVIGRLCECQLDQVVVVDLSREDWPVSVVRVIVPGLEALIDSPAYRPGARARALRSTTR